MDADRNLKFFLIKGFINGHEKNSMPVNALFLGVSEGMNLRFLKTRFTTDPIDMNIPLSDLPALLNAPGTQREDSEDSEENNDSLPRYEKRLHDFISAERVFVTEKRALDAKAIERAITHFCSFDLEISAITFAEVISASEEDVSALLSKLKWKPSDGAKWDSPEEGNREADQAADGKNADETNEIFVECNAVIDPVAGLPASKLSIGQEICCRLPEDSPFYKICKSNLPNFNGVVSGGVTGVKTNEFGNSVISMSLAEGISGVMKVQGNIWIKTGPDNAPRQETANSKLPRYILLGAVGAALLIIIIGILFHFMN
ncbi:MAG: hypothetical protein LBS45_03340 [Synergistaceae bacterium]|jgi:hypothetical protein|nr:hypothetical protein [Synergistaceae bacterium]